METCLIPHCERSARTRGRCQSHYVHFWRYGTDEYVKTSVSVEDAFRKKMPGEPPPPWVVWPWTGTVGSGGYGKVHFKGREYLAHRVSYEMFIGPIPRGLLVRHKNDTPIDVNPHNLELGTTADNMRDRDSRGRGRSVGALNNRALLSNDDVASIRSLHATGAARSELAKMFGISKATVYDIVAGRTWRHLL